MTEERKEIGEVEYRRIHRWLAKEFERPPCEHCGTTEKLQWALIKGKKYKQDRNCFMSLCLTCHKSYDQKGHVPWNIGKGNGIPAWNKGMIMPKGSGGPPWNKGKKLSEKHKKAISDGFKRKKI